MKTLKIESFLETAFIIFISHMVVLISLFIFLKK